MNLTGFAVLAFFGDKLPLVYAASLFIGFAYGSSMAQSLSSMELFPASEYEEHYSRLNVIGGLINLPMPYLASYFYDTKGSFSPVFAIFSGFMVLGIVLIAFRNKLLRG